MRAYIQWALAVPRDYEAHDLTRIQQVRALPRKQLPVGGELLDALPGWLADLNVQGVSFAGWDHVSFGFAGGFQVIAWNDDPEDYPDGPHAHVWTFHAPAPDPRYGGQVNTRQSLTVYADDPAQVAFWTGQTTTSGPVVVRPWAEFAVPSANATIHGIWQSDASFAAHRVARTPHGWREWIGG